MNKKQTLEQIRQFEWILAHSAYLQYYRTPTSLGIQGFGKTCDTAEVWLNTLERNGYRMYGIQGGKTVEIDSKYHQEDMGRIFLSSIDKYIQQVEK